jgi:1-aminocyclopropane-1-carboxylate deaminase/D-cysteine desulfhydrase-like pyridoxal-dependent ACC family enzyme
MDQFGEGYGLLTGELIEAGRLFAHLEALMPEQADVAKTFSGLLSRIARQDIPPAKRAGILH